MEPLLRTLFVHTPGTRLILEGNAVKALRDDIPARRLPLEAIDTLVVTAGVDVSTPLLIHCAEAGRVVAFLSANGKPRAIVEGMADGRSALRRLQYAAHADPERRAGLAADMVSAKLYQMAWALRQWSRDAAASTQLQLRETAEQLDQTAARLRGSGSDRDIVLGIEGESSRRYFECLGRIVRDGVWQGRRRRPATDPLNAMLSWFYGLTRIAVHGAMMVTGLDPGTGFLHGDRPGQPSLVLDLMEELRPAADRLALRMWNTRQLQDKHFTRGLGGAVEISPEGREVLFDNWHRQRAQEVRVKGRSGLVPNGFIPIMQAHTLANALRQATAYQGHQRSVR
jgi:CRISPR-associated protein Cas1